MDKKNHHDDLGGLHSKPPPNALPPIWEDIAGALDAADDHLQEKSTLSTDAEHEAEVADYAAIKAGFVATFEQQEPPKFLWDTIEQDLEANVETDAATEFSSIKDSFLAAFGEQHPPQSLWEELVERVDQPAIEEPVEEKANYSRIKNSFERKYSALVVPLFSWNDLVERMDAEAVSADTRDRFSCIKESFEAVYAGKEPNAAVATGLWQRLYPLSPIWGAAQQLAQAPWAKRTAVALLLFLGLGTWYGTTPTGYSLASSEDIERRELDFPVKNRAALSPNGQHQATTNAIEEQHLSLVMDGAIFLEQFFSSLATDELPTKEKKAQNLSTSPIANNQVEGAVIAREKENNKHTTGVKNNKRAVKEPLFVTSKKVFATTTNNNASTNGKEITPTNATGLSTKKEQTILAKEEVNGTPASNSLSSNRIKTIENLSTKTGTLTAPILPAAHISLVEEGWTALSRNYIPNPAIARMEEKSFREVRPTVRGKKMHFEFGIEGRLGTSVLLEKKGLEEGDKDISLCPTGAVGVNFQYYFGMNDALVVGAYPYSTTIQCWDQKTPNSRGYEEKAMHLSFMDLTLGYQRILSRYNGLTEEPASIYARFNLGVGWLTNANTRINQQSINTPNLYKNLNWNAGLAIGSLHEMQRFVLDYGLMGNIGLNQFITGAQPNVLQPARIVNIGAYIGLRYLFMRRRAPSKKQRQFDWSAPFYIEEPKF